MSCSHRSLLADTLVHYLFFEWYGVLFLLLKYFLLLWGFPRQLHAALILAYISSFVVSLKYVVCPRYLNFVNFSIFPCSISISSLPVQFVMYFVCLLCTVKPTFRLSEFRLFKCLSIFVIVEQGNIIAKPKVLRYSPAAFRYPPS